MDQIAANCPNGHKIKGPRRMAGRLVRCPRCQAEFWFQAPAAREVTDTGVMRILGDDPLPPLPPPPRIRTEPTTRPCPRCEQTISLSSTVCKHCSCFVGAAVADRKPIGGAQGPATDSLR